MYQPTWVNFISLSFRSMFGSLWQIQKPKTKEEQSENIFLWIGDVVVVVVVVVVVDFDFDDLYSFWAELCHSGEVRAENRKSQPSQTASN